MESTSKDKIVKSDAKALVDWACKTNNLVVSESDTPIKKCELIDVKLKRSNEDEVFLTDDEVYERVRRGNCIISYQREGVEVHEVGRKGLIKFFDYKVKYRNKKDEKKMKKRVLENIRKAFDSKKQIVIYLSEKANGENLQIAYQDFVKAWIIGSKNVTILCRDREDIEWYKFKSQNPQKYSFCIEFAHLWFDILEKRIISQGKLEDFIKEISGHTLIGENVGDPNHQHIQLYTEKDIVFYSMVKNNSEDICIPLPLSHEILSVKYGLTYVKFIQSPIFDNFEEMKTYMDKVYEEVLLKSVEEAGEGQVAYFASIDTDGVKVISLGKLKTFEYRFLRKLREKLKGFKTNVEDVLKKIKSESEEILGEEGEEIELDRWMKLAEFVLNHVKKSTFKVNFTDHYASFIYDMKTLYEKSISGVDNCDHAIHNISKKNEGEAAIQVDSKIDMLLFDEIENEDAHHKGKSKSKSKKGQKNKKIENENSKINSEVEDEAEEITGFLKGNVYFLLNFGLVAGGKSTFLEILKQIIEEKYKTSINLMYISSDKYRRVLIDQYIEKKPATTIYEAHEKVDSAYKFGFNKEIVNIIKNNRVEDKINLMYIDKNFTPDSANSFYRSINENIYLNCSFEIIIFHPKVNHPMKEFPFSWSYFIQTYYRLKNRKDHESLDSEKHPCPHYILLSFLSLFKGKNFHMNNKKVSLYPITFTEEKQLDVPADISKLFKQIMNGIRKVIFEIDRMKSFDNLITKLFIRIEKEFPLTTFGDTKDIMWGEIDRFLKDRVIN